MHLKELFNIEEYKELLFFLKDFLEILEKLENEINLTIALSKVNVEETLKQKIENLKIEEKNYQEIMLLALNILKLTNILSEIQENIRKAKQYIKESIETIK